MEELLRPGERVDDLQRKGYRIIQNGRLFCFGMDAVLLAAFAGVKRGERMLDLGTGTGRDSHFAGGQDGRRIFCRPGDLRSQRGYGGPQRKAERTGRKNFHHPGRYQRG